MKLNAKQNSIIRKGTIGVLLAAFLCAPLTASAGGPRHSRRPANVTHVTVNNYTQNTIYVAPQRSAYVHNNSGNGYGYGYGYESRRAPRPVYRSHRSCNDDAAVAAAAVVGTVAAIGIFSALCD